MPKLNPMLMWGMLVRRRWRKEPGLFLVNFTSNLRQNEVILAPVGFPVLLPGCLFRPAQIYWKDRVSFKFPRLGQSMSSWIPLMEANPEDSWCVPGLGGDPKPLDPRDLAAVFDKETASGVCWCIRLVQTEIAAQRSLTVNILSP